MADAIATIVGLLAAQVFFIGFLLQRLDVLLDKTKERIDRTRDRLEATPALGLSFEIASADALECRGMIDDEIRRSRARPLIVAAPLLCVLVWYLALRDELGSTSVWAWRKSLTHDVTRWDVAATSAGALTLVSIFISAYALYRSSVTRQATRRYFHERDIAPVATVARALLALGRDEADDRPQALIDEATSALMALDNAWPQWEWTPTLHGEYWFFVAGSARFRQLLAVEREAALRNALAHYESVPTNADSPMGWLQLRLGTTKRLLAGENPSSPDAPGWLAGAQDNFQRAEKDPLTASEAIEPLVDVLWTMRDAATGPAARGALTRAINSALARGRAARAPSVHVTLAWVDWNLDGEGNASLNELADALCDQLRRLARVIRSARHDAVVLHYGRYHAEEPVLWLRRLSSRVPAGEELVDYCGDFAQLANAATARELLAVQKRNSRRSDIEVLATALRCADLANQSAFQTVRAFGALWRRPVRNVPRRLRTGGDVIVAAVAFAPDMGVAALIWVLKFVARQSGTAVRAIRSGVRNVADRFEKLWNRVRK